MNDGMNDFKDFFGSVGVGLVCLIGPPVLIVLLIGIPLEVFLGSPPWAAALPGAVLVYSVGFLAYWENFSRTGRRRAAAASRATRATRST